MALFRNDQRKAESERPDTANPSAEEKTSTMLTIMDWAFEKANSNIPGLGTSEEMAANYLRKCNGNVQEAVDSLIRWQTTYAASAGFASSFGGFSTMIVTLPANIAGVLAIQLRMIGAISCLSGNNLLREEKRTASYICLLGGEAGNVLANVASEFSVKIMTSALHNLSEEVLLRINRAVGFRLFTKFSSKGLINLGKIIPVLGGVVGASIDAFSTYTIAQTAKAMFLKDILDIEKQERAEVEKFKVLINMALVDGCYADSERNVLLAMAQTESLSPKNKAVIDEMIAHPKRSAVDLKAFKKDKMLSAYLVGSLHNVVLSDGPYSPAEKIYMKSLIKELGFSEEELKELFS